MSHPEFLSFEVGLTRNVPGRDIESFVAEAERRVRKLALPPGVTFAFTGAHEIQQATQRELLPLGPAAGRASY